jgi:hypothetical protein
MTEIKNGQGLQNSKGLQPSALLVQTDFQRFLLLLLTLNRDMITPSAQLNLENQIGHSVQPPAVEIPLTPY